MAERTPTPVDALQSRTEIFGRIDPSEVASLRGEPAKKGDDKKIDVLERIRFLRELAEQDTALQEKINHLIPELLGRDVKKGMDDLWVLVHDLVVDIEPKLDDKTADEQAKRDLMAMAIGQEYLSAEDQEFGRTLASVRSGEVVPSLLRRLATAKPLDSERNKATKNDELFQRKRQRGFLADKLRAVDQKQIDTTKESTQRLSQLIGICELIQNNLESSEDAKQPTQNQKVKAKACRIELKRYLDSIGDDATEVPQFSDGLIQRNKELLEASNLEPVRKKIIENLKNLLVDFEKETLEISKKADSLRDIFSNFSDSLRGVFNYDEHRFCNQQLAKLWLAKEELQRKLQEVKAKIEEMVARLEECEDRTKETQVAEEVERLSFLKDEIGDDEKERILGVPVYYEALDGLKSVVDSLTKIKTAKGLGARRRIDQRREQEKREIEKAYERAREVFGEDNVFGPEEIVAALTLADGTELFKPTDEDLERIGHELLALFKKPGVEDFLKRFQKERGRRETSPLLDGTLLYAPYGMNKEIFRKLNDDSQQRNEGKILSDHFLKYIYDASTSKYEMDFSRSGGWRIVYGRNIEKPTSFAVGDKKNREVCYQYDLFSTDRSHECGQNNSSLGEAIFEAVLHFRIHHQNFYQRFGGPGHFGSSREEIFNYFGYGTYFSIVLSFGSDGIDVKYDDETIDISTTRNSYDPACWRRLVKIS